MYFTSIRLQNYRSYSDSSFEFEPGVNIIVGKNATGKTNLIDALYFSANGSPIKSGKDFIIKIDQPWARIDVLTSDNSERIIKLKVNESTEYLQDDKIFKRLPYDQKVPIVLFEPNQLYQISSSPEQRRLFLDDLLGKLSKHFISLKNSYIRTLRQRNNLLKQPLSQVKQQIFAWDIRLSELAGQYVAERLMLVDKINQNSGQIYSTIAQKEHKLELGYETKVNTTNYSSTLLKLFQSKLDIDHLRGFTSYGPHREDVSIKINGEDMRSVASRGEARSILLALKIIETNLLEEKYNQKPLLLLDDVFGELDGARRKSLIDFMSGAQTFITTTDADIIGHDFIKKTKIIAI